MYGMEAVGYMQLEIVGMYKVQNRVGRLVVATDNFVAEEALRGDGMEHL